MDDDLFYFSETQTGLNRTRHHDDGLQQYFLYAHRRKGADWRSGSVLDS